MRNDFTHIAWETTEFPSETVGTYLIRTAKPLGRRSSYGIATVSEISNGHLTIIGGLFGWDALCGGNAIVAWARLDESHAPREE